MSFETNNSEIDLNAVLLIFVNGVIQEPGQHYQFEGGTSFTFTEAPGEDDKIDIFFYRGSRGTDSVSVNTVETVKQGDILTLKKRDNDPNTLDQDPRTIYNITTSDKVETNLYTGLGISTVPSVMVDLGILDQQLLLRYLLLVQSVLVLEQLHLLL